MYPYRSGIVKRLFSVHITKSMAQLEVAVRPWQHVQGAANLQAALCRRKEFFYLFIYFFLRIAIQSQSLTLKKFHFLTSLKSVNFFLSFQLFKSATNS